MRASNLKAGWAVAKRELIDQASSLRFLAILLLVILMTPLSIYVGVRNYQARLQDYRLLKDERQGLIESENGKRVWGFDDDETAINELIVLRVLRPPQPLSILIHGLDGALPKYWDFSEVGIIHGPPASTKDRLADTFPHLDFEFLLRAVMGLLAALLGYDAVVGEKEAGTLRAALSHPISRRLFFAGKLLGGVITLLLALALAFLIALICSFWMAPDLLDQAYLSKLTLMGVASALYLVCFYLLGLMISSLTSTQKTSLLVTLVAWFLLALAVAPLATLVARAASPVRTFQSFMAEKSSLDSKLEAEAASDMGEVYEAVTGMSAQVSAAIFRQQWPELEERITSIRVRYLNDRRRELGTLDRSYQAEKQRQHEIARTIMMISPALAFASACTDLAGTGDTHYASWQTSIRQYYQRLGQKLFEDPPTVLLDNNGAKFRASLRDAVSLDSLPEFVAPSGDTTAAFRRALPAVGFLLVSIIIFLVGGLTAFSRYDVR